MFSFTLKKFQTVIMKGFGCSLFRLISLFKVYDLPMFLNVHIMMNDDGPIKRDDVLLRNE
jgi:hypothetical protein